jgi:uncharacterized membrane protein YdbT with pleckstrin-like domain
MTLNMRKALSGEFLDCGLQGVIHDPKAHQCERSLHLLDYLSIVVVVVIVIIVVVVVIVTPVIVVPRYQQFGLRVLRLSKLGALN